jgi:phage shock protein B
MDGAFIAFMVPAILFTIFVAPVWVFMHYRSKQRSRHELSERERELLERLIVQAEQMTDRIETLESILDHETPGWRGRAHTNGYTGAARAGREVGT